MSAPTGALISACRVAHPSLHPDGRAGRHSVQPLCAAGGSSRCRRCAGACTASSRAGRSHARLKAARPGSAAFAQLLHTYFEVPRAAADAMRGTHLVRGAAGTAAAAWEADGRSSAGQGTKLQAVQRTRGGCLAPAPPCGTPPSCWHTSGGQSERPPPPCPQPTAARAASRCAGARCRAQPRDPALPAHPLPQLLRPRRPPGHGLCSCGAWRVGWLAAAAAWAAARRLLRAPRRRWRRQAAGGAQEPRLARHPLPLLADAPSPLALADLREKEARAD